MSLAKVLTLLNVYRILPGYYLFAYTVFHHLTNCDFPVMNDSLRMSWVRMPALSHRFWSPPAVNVRCLYIFFSSEYSITCSLVTRIPALPIGTHYLGPNASEANPCVCSSVTYSAISACAGCQNRTYIDWLRWSQNCTSIFFTTFESIHINSMITVHQLCFSRFPEPLPSTVEVPSWAYLNLSLVNGSNNRA